MKSSFTQRILILAFACGLVACGGSGGGESSDGGTSNSGTESEETNSDSGSTSPNSGPPTISFSATSVSENSINNNGSITDVITIDIDNNLFVSSPTTLTENIHYTISGNSLPIGLSLSVVVTGNKQAEIHFAGTANNHNSANSISGVIFTLNKEAFRTPLDPSDKNSASNSFSVNFDDNISLISSSNTFSEGGKSFSGEINEFVEVSVFADTFTVPVGNQLILGVHYLLLGTVPGGLSFKTEVTANNKVKLFFDGTATNNNNSDDVNGGLRVDFLNAAFTGGETPTDGSDKQTYSIDFRDTLPIVLYNAGLSTGLNGFNEYDDIKTLCSNTKPSGLEQTNTHPFVSGTGSQGLAINVFKDNLDIPTAAQVEGPTGIKVADSWIHLVHNLSSNINASFKLAEVVPSSSLGLWTYSNADGSMDASNICNQLIQNPPRGTTASGAAIGATRISTGLTTLCSSQRHYVCLAFE